MMPFGCDGGLHDTRIACAPKTNAFTAVGDSGAVKMNEKKINQFIYPQNS